MAKRGARRVPAMAGERPQSRRGPLIDSRGLRPREICYLRNDATSLYRTSVPTTTAAGYTHDPQHYRLHAEICKVLTDPKRLMLLDALRGGERSVGQLAEAIGVALPSASQHLSVLRGTGLVDARRSGTTVFYRLVEPAIVEACDVIDRIVRRRVSQPADRAAESVPPAAATR